MASSNSKCVICGLNIATISSGVDGYYSVNCRDCGRYLFQVDLYKGLQKYYDKDIKEKLRRCAVMMERNIKGFDSAVKIGYNSDRGFYFEDTGESISSHFPQSFQDRLLRGFCNVMRSLKFYPVVAFRLNGIQHETRPLLFIDDSFVSEEIVMDYICAEGWLESPASAGALKHYRATTKGMTVFERSENNGSRNTAFLAMWFGVNGSDTYRNAVNNAVKAAGYHLQVVDKEDYNGFIMDKVVNLINDSAFVIADISAAPERITDKGVFDGVRGGVYWEAGYAAGQKKQVVLTCNDDPESKQRIHFDLQQYNQIRWKFEDGVITTTDNRDFENSLTQRILATVGKGKAVL